MFNSASQEEIYDCDSKFNDYLTNISIQNFDFLMENETLLRLILEKFLNFIKQSNLRIWDLKRLYDIDFSSVSPIFKPKHFSTLMEEFNMVKDVKYKETVELEYDFKIKFPPKKRTVVNLNIVNVKKGEPKVYLDDFKYIEETEKEE